jgi:hypothetical protein
VEPWIDGLWPALKRFLKLPGAELGGGDAENITVNTHIISTNNTTLTGSTVIETGNKSTQSDISKNSTVPILTNGKKEENAESSQMSCDINQSDCNNSCVTQTTSSTNKINIVHETENGTSHTTSNDSSIKKCGVAVSLPPLSESTLTVPLLPPSFLKIEFHPEQSVVS